ncbi:uncharacterized protein A1O5_01689 [Cladophialophora psammophila CBS 110553]|uniref:Uncharacterized protein n=1 Tax=Cladophialophora psammophila CBS 110553 TaxID=1182543 RepID=W9X482_9EURO|nr:uncharacterized protein A1O5_01689 [Cladophialophora psammophila CBS 110553]EXJ74993.1 hypothetical protein A1O5_01689 [Cladophialophora psammophila CBS 110553]
MKSYIIPFQSEHELCASLSIDHGRLVAETQKHYLPSHPLISLEEDEILPFVEKDLLTPSLNRMSPWLWLLATPMSTHVSALHAQIVRGRNIVVAEDPELHLVWISDRVFVKPLPTYLLSHAFWSYLMLSSKAESENGRCHTKQILQAALGYVRTYTHLIQHESDLRIAQRECLVPQCLDLETWAAFIRDFRSIEDWQVSGRYHYGELRLTRLNFWAKPLLRRLYFRKATWPYAEHFAKYFAPLLFIFGMWSLVLGSMQVGLQARPSWDILGDLGAWFTVATLASVLAVAAFLLGGFCILAGREMWYAFGKQIRKRRQRREARAAPVSKVEAEENP